MTILEDYPQWLIKIKQRISSVRQQNTSTFNQELLQLFWQIGTDILQRQTEQITRREIIDQIVKDLSLDFPELNWFSRFNLQYMCQFSEAWPQLIDSNSSIFKVITQISWELNVVLLGKLKTQEQRLWYAKKTIEEDWSQGFLVDFIESGWMQQVRSNEAIEQITDYFKSSKKEFSIGIQNFQGVREYIEIPLAPITLLYGQNSAGKSSVHDALEFICNFLGGKWDSRTTTEYLDRWANYNRNSIPLTKGYLGEFDDVVLSVCASVDDMDCLEWVRTYYKDRADDHESPAYRLFEIGYDETIPIKIDMFFSKSLGISATVDWYLKKFSLSLGREVFIERVVNENIGYGSTCILNFRRQHLVYKFMDSYFEEGVDTIVEDILAEGLLNTQWLSLEGMDTNGILQWKNPIGWSDTRDSEDFYNNQQSPPIDTLRFRGFVASLLAVPALAAAKRLDFVSIPPIRKIPTKETAIIRKISREGRIFKSNLVGWSTLASHVFSQHVFEKYPSDDVEDDGIKSKQQSMACRNTIPKYVSHFSCPVLDEVNHLLSHPLFLNLEYEISGECFFLTPLDFFKENIGSSNKQMRNLLEALDSEVHLKLRHKPTGNLVEIEDVGVGISQIIPVLEAIVTNTKVFIQQPELHLHPKLQAQLADVFIERMYKNSKCYNFFFIESHSEHFLLRLLRRIRETSKSDIKNKLFSLSPEHVSVLYVDKLEDGSSKILPLRISPDGDFIDRWPNGFFTERDGELFDE